MQTIQSSLMIVWIMILEIPLSGLHELTHPQIVSKGQSLKSFFINIFQ